MRGKEYAEKFLAETKEIQDYGSPKYAEAVAQVVTAIKAEPHKVGIAGFRESIQKFGCFARLCNKSYGQDVINKDGYKLILIKHVSESSNKDNPAVQKILSEIKKIQA